MKDSVFIQFFNINNVLQYTIRRIKNFFSIFVFNTDIYCSTKVRYIIVGNKIHFTDVNGFLQSYTTTNEIDDIYKKIFDSFYRINEICSIYMCNNNKENEIKIYQTLEELRQKCENLVDISCEGEQIKRQEELQMMRDKIEQNKKEEERKKWEEQSKKWEEEARKWYREKERKRQEEEQRRRKEEEERRRQEEQRRQEEERFMYKKREQELRELYWIWKEEEIKWQKMQEEERRRKEEDRRWKEEMEIKHELSRYIDRYGNNGVVDCPECKGRGYKESTRFGYPNVPCITCNRSGKLDRKNPSDEEKLIRLWKNKKFRY